MPPSSSSIPVYDHGHACDGADRSSASKLPLLSSSAPPSRQRPLADDQDHHGATCQVRCDDGGDGSSPSSSPWRCCRATTGSQIGLPAAPRPGSPPASFSVSASTPPFRRRIHESAITSKVGGSATGVVEEDVDQNAADRDVEPDGQRHTRQPPVAVEAAAPRTVDGRQRQRHHERRQHGMGNEKPEE